MLKTYGYMVAIETERIIDPKVVEAAIEFHLNHSDYKYENVNVGALGEIDCYPEAEENE